MLVGGECQLEVNQSVNLSRTSTESDVYAGLRHPDPNSLDDCGQTIFFLSLQSQDPLQQLHGRSWAKWRVNYLGSWGCFRHSYLQREFRTAYLQHS